MSKKRKVLLIPILGLIALSLIWILFTLSIRSEFIDYLSKTYPEQRFSVGFIKYDPLYGNYFADATCLNDTASFGISRNAQTKRISDNYSGIKRANQYNLKIKAIFNKSNIQGDIRNVSGWSKMPFEDDGVYDGISLTLTENADLAEIADQTMKILKENNVSYKTIDLIQEKDLHVNELRLSSADNALSKSDLEAKIERRK